MFVWIIAVCIMLYNFFASYEADKLGKKEPYIIYRFFLAAPVDYVKFIYGEFKKFTKHGK